tara:strand:+ start:4424 stop:5257 length:834 start_codon:yes stop_codon:yes gene_type:complete
VNRLTLLGIIFLCCCGDARYRLDGHVPETTSHVELLDGAATEKIVRLRTLYASAFDSLADVADAEIADVRARLDESESDLEAAKRGVNRASARYRQTFEKMKQFESFGGNPIFGDEDRRVSTRELLSEIADRFYKGKAFSLETGGEIRSFIRESLVPSEQRVSRARRRLRRVESSRETDEAAIVARQGFLVKEQDQLRDIYNQRILDTLTGAVQASAQADSNGYYRFDTLSPARYHLYLRDPVHSLSTVDLVQHTRRDLDPQEADSPLLTGSGPQSF